MRWFPDLLEEFTSPLPPAELLRRVQASVQPTGDFAGKVTATQFSIRRVIAYRNGMLPRITGEVSAGPGGGSRLRLRHRLPLFTRWFAVVWLGAVGSVVVMLGAMLVISFFRPAVEGPGWPALLPMAMLAFGLALFTVPFWAEVRQSRPRLMALLQLVSVAPVQ